MSAISTILTRLRAAIWAIDVRDDIANAIEQCYSDVSNPTLQTEALEAALQTKIDEGEMAALTIGDHTITAAKLAQGVIDNTLATSGAAADAKKTGDEITAIKADLGAIGDPKTATAALISCICKMAWLDDISKDYLTAAFDMILGSEFPKIVVNNNGGDIYTSDSVNGIKSKLTVTYFADDESAGVVLASNAYDIIGSVDKKTDAILVRYLTKSVLVPIRAIEGVDIPTLYNLGTNVYIRDGGTDVNNSKPALIAYTSAYQRKALYVDNGLKEFIDGSTGNIITGKYPLPIRSDTKYIVVSSNQTMCYNCVQFSYSNGEYTKIGGIGWQQQGTIMQLSDNVEYIEIAFRKSASSEASLSTPSVLFVECLTDNGIYSRKTQTLGGTLQVRNGGVSTKNGNPSLIGYTSAYPRKSLYATTGRKTFVDNSTGDAVTGYYPIPIAPNANKICVYSDESCYTTFTFWSYNESNNTYTKINDQGWTSTGTEVSVPEGAQFVTIGMRKNQNTETTFNDPTALTIKYS